jgi:hypothetical protein
MKELARYRAMESLCRQSAVFNPLESWRLLAEAEMWHHKAQDEITSLFAEGNDATSIAAPTKTAMLPHARREGLPAG